jgi:hypothetical protein
MLTDAFERGFSTETLEQNENSATNRRGTIHSGNTMHKNALVVFQTFNDPICLFANFCKSHSVCPFPSAAPTVIEVTALSPYPAACLLPQIEDRVYLRPFCGLNIQTTNKESLTIPVISDPNINWIAPKASV